MLIANAKELQDWGESFAHKLLAEKREGALVIQLVGDLGAGKTTLTQGIARGLGVSAQITSPTFTVHKEYVSKDKKTELHHFDFYRLPDLGIMKHEMQELAEDPNNIIVIEWGGILGGLIKTTKTIKIEKLDGEKRALIMD
ncbi:tRNA (adenosine(37)-N6)-threonylcarbamoyltransferase complex ATPase subunit type 1 TsaE [Candidatus Saccharibacteria bacterium]|nr:tRNA (adenosine(37)-N6)-threonylcarbamoyltransferase complex ATPase subunit type 1 TsaE [Candidatus Saccharibacteria bacterium]